MRVETALARRGDDYAFDIVCKRFQLPRPPQPLCALAGVGGLLYTRRMPRGTIYRLAMVDARWRDRVALSQSERRATAEYGTGHRYSTREGWAGWAKLTLELLPLPPVHLCGVPPAVGPIPARQYAALSERELTGTASAPRPQSRGTAKFRAPPQTSRARNGNHSRCRRGRGAPSNPGGCGKAEPGPGADVTAVSSFPVRIWAGVSPVPEQMWQG